MAEKARIVFSSEKDVVVVGTASDVIAKLLEPKEPFTGLQKENGRDIYVAADLVAYVEDVQVPSPSSAMPAVGHRESPHRIG
jgi:hypothetical protein